MPSDPPDTTGAVIPMARSTTPKPFANFLKHAPVSVKDILGARTPSVMDHAWEAAFALTYNKLQGATVERLILVLRNLSGVARLGNMTVQKLFVALSRVRQGKHLAIFPTRISELLCLTGKQSTEKLRVWHTHYDNNGNYRPDAIVLSEVDTVLARIPQMRLAALGNVSLHLLRTICKKIGIFFKRMTHEQILNAVRPVWRDYLRRYHAEHRQN